MELLNSFGPRHRGPIWQVRRWLFLWGMNSLLIVVPQWLYAQANLVWAARIASCAQCTNEPAALAVDSAGNVYFTGTANSGTNTDFDIYTTKRAPDGALLWEARYNGPSSRDDKASAMAFDSNGNVFVTGFSFSTTSGNDFVTIKYNPSGNVLWVRRYNGPGNGDDQARALVVDGSGNVYVTGKAYVTSTTVSGLTSLDFAYVTIKYDGNGNQLWLRRYANGHDDTNPHGSGNQEPQAIALDNAGNVIVTGISVFFADPRAPGAGFAVVRYSPTGSELGAWRYDSFSNSDGASGKVTGVMSAGGELHLAGTMPTASPPPFYTTLKYDTNGARQWVRSYTGGYPYGPGGNRAQGAVVDRNNCLLVTGASPNSSNGSACATVKFDSAGNQLWAARMNVGLVEALAGFVALDSANNPYVVTSILNTNQVTDLVLLKYSDAGEPRWETRFVGRSTGHTRPKAVAMDLWGNILIAAVSPSITGTGMDTVILKYHESKALITRLPNGHMRLDFVGTPSVTNLVQFSADLVHWYDLGTRVADPGGAFSFEDPEPATYPVRFYRAMPQ